MGTLTAVEFISLDGVGQSPGRPDEDTRGGFTAGGWASSRMDEVAAAAAMGGQGETAGLLFGRRTYFDLVGHWLGTEEPNPFTGIIRDTPKYVATRTLAEPLRHPNSDRLQGDAIHAVRQLKDQLEGELVLLGSLQLLHALAAAGLVDTYVLSTVPVLLGSGTRVFDTPAPADLELTASTASPNGIIVATYTRR